RIGKGGVGGSTCRPEAIGVWVEAFEYDPEMEYFLGGLVRKASRAVGKVARAAGKVAGTVGKIPILGDIARAGVGAVRLGLGPAAIAIDAGSRLARGQSLGAALKGAVAGQIDALRNQLKLAEMVAPFVPGIGTGVAAALGAANALAAGRPITEALLASARSALPGGAVAQSAFDVALNLAKGKNITKAALEAVREPTTGRPSGARRLRWGGRPREGQTPAGRRLCGSRHDPAALTLCSGRAFVRPRSGEHSKCGFVGGRSARGASGPCQRRARGPPSEGLFAGVAFTNVTILRYITNLALYSPQGWPRLFSALAFGN